MLLLATPAAVVALALAAHSPRLTAHVPAAAACHRGSSMLARPPLRAARVLMKADTFYDEYLQTDPTTGEQQALSLNEKERLYLDCLDAFYNEDGRQLLENDEYEQLKNDLNFEGSTISTLEKDEIKFVLANKRYQMGKPILSDDEYDALRQKLKTAGSLVVLHEAPSCTLEGICKTDLRVDDAKQRLLYFPGTAGGVILGCEACFWTLHLDPIFSILLTAVPAYFFGKWFTENIFAQQPLVTQAPCPECSYLTTVYFGDLFNVQADGITTKPTSPPPDEILLNCPNCKVELRADRKQMLLVTANPKVAA